MAEVGFSHLILTTHFRDRIRGARFPISHFCPLNRAASATCQPNTILLYLSTYACVILRVLLLSMTIMMRLQLVVTNQIGRLI